MDTARERRWRSEAEFFDETATRASANGDAIDPAVFERYASRRRPWLRREYCLGLLREVRGKTVLDVGCGLGDDAILLARYGAAHVVGIDISSRSIDLARRRAICA